MKAWGFNVGLGRSLLEGDFRNGDHRGVRDVSVAQQCTDDQRAQDDNDDGLEVHEITSIVLKGIGILTLY